MNKIYKLVWNQVRGCYVVASEFAKAHGKSARRAVVGAFVAAAMVSGAASAYAAGTVADGSEGAIIKGMEVIASGKNSSAIGRSNIAIGANSFAAGFLSTANGYASFALGHQALTGDKAQDAIALGYQAWAYGDRSVAMGFCTKAYGSSSTAMGARSEAHGDNSLAAMGGVTGEGASGSMAFGVGAKALKANTYAIGVGAEAQANDTIAFGNGAKAMQNSSIAIGISAQAQGANTVALGAGAKAQAENAVAIGNGSVADQANTVSVGSAGNERKIVNVADGKIEANSKEVVNGGQLYTEIERAKAAESGFAQAVEDEKTRAMAAEKVNADAIVAETTRATTAEEALKNYVQGSVDDLDVRVTTAQGNIDTQVRLMSELLLDKGVGARNIIFSNGIEGSLVEREGEPDKLVLGLKDQFDANEHFTFTDTTRSRYSVDVSNKGFIAEDHNVNGDYKSTLDEKGLSVTQNGSGVTITANGIDMGGTKVTGLGKGELSANSTDAVNGAQLYETNEAVKANTKAIAENKDAIAGNKSAIETNTKNIATNTQNIARNAKAIEDNTKEIVKNRIDIEVNKVEIANNKAEIEGNKSAIANNTKNIEKNAEGIAENRAAIEKLNDNMSGINTRMNHLDKKIDRTGAHAAALAALRPADFDGKLSVAAGLGTYHGSQAAAVGVFYKPTERISLNMGATMGGRDNMGNLGISFALDRSVKGEPSKKDLIAETRELKAENAQLKEKLEKYEVQELRAENAEMKVRMAQLEAMVKALAAK